MKNKFENYDETEMAIMKADFPKELARSKAWSAKVACKAEGLESVKAIKKAYKEDCERHLTDPKWFTSRKLTMWHKTENRYLEELRKVLPEGMNADTVLEKWWQEACDETYGA